MNFHSIGDLFFPPACVSCGDGIVAGAICVPCRTGITLFNTFFCGTCSARLPEAKKICHVDAPYLLGAAGSYDDDPLRALVHALKFQGIAGAAEPLAEILAEYICKVGVDLDGYTVTPLPLSTKRHRARGFNQSALIAQRFAALTGLPFEEHILERIRHRKPQSETDDILERRENIRDCFALKNLDAARGKRVVLMDDVTTSGTTFAEAARVLRSGGAKKILALAAAKA